MIIVRQLLIFASVLLAICLLWEGLIVSHREPTASSAVRLAVTVVGFACGTIWGNQISKSFEKPRRLLWSGLTLLAFLVGMLLADAVLMRVLGVKETISGFAPLLGLAFGSLWHWKGSSSLSNKEL